MSLDSVVVDGFSVLMDEDSLAEVCSFVDSLGDGSKVLLGLLALSFMRAACRGATSRRRELAAVRLHAQCTEAEALRAVEVASSDAYRLWLESLSRLVEYYGAMGADKSSAARH